MYPVLPDAPIYDEKELLLRVAGGDEVAFRELFHRFYRPLSIHIHRFTESRELTEEVLQDVFLKIWMARETLTEVTLFRAYLMTIARNYTLNCLRKIARDRVAHTRWEQDGRAFLDQGGTDPEYTSLIDQAIDLLPPQQQKAFLLSRYNGLTYEQIGAQMQLSPKTVKKHVQLAIASVTKYLRTQLPVVLPVMTGLLDFLKKD